MAAVSTAVQRGAPVYRRKMSINESELRPRGSPGSDLHQRSVTDDSGHPLVRDKTQHAKGLSYDYDLLEADVGVTRPTLDRRVDESTQPVVAVDWAEPASEEKEEGQQLLVLVHQVQSKDSLAGVALRYGISIADLRRANQLWSSDTIHLREVLYIPLNQTTQSTSKHLLIDLTTPTGDAAANGVALETNSTDPNIPSSQLSNIRRIPASKLSFFPPPAQRKPVAIPSSSSSSDYFTPRIPSSQRPNGVLSSPFGSILTAVAGRVSLDSASSGERSEELELELRDVRRKPRSSNPTTNGHSRGGSHSNSTSTSPPVAGSYWRRNFDTIAQSTTRPRSDLTELVDLFSPNNDPSSAQKPSASSPPVTSSSSRTINGSTASYRDTDRDRDVDLSRSRTHSIRTVQLEPSPGMRVPPPSVPGMQTGLPRANGKHQSSVERNSQHRIQTVRARGTKGGRGAGSGLGVVFGDLWGEDRDGDGENGSEGTLI